MADKKVKIQLVGLDGNAFNLMGAWQREARRQGWKKPEIDAVITKCTSGDYNNLLCTLMNNSEEPETESDSEEDADECPHCGAKLDENGGCIDNCGEDD